jgi:hypothetical protein
MDNGLEITHEFSPVGNSQERLGPATLGGKAKIPRYKTFEKTLFLKLGQLIAVKPISAFSQLFQIMKTLQDILKLLRECIILDLTKTEKSNKL